MSIDVNHVLERLNEYLKQESVSAHFVTCGGALIYLSGHGGRVTQDVDVLEGFTKALQKASESVAKELNLGEDWLNPFVEVYVEHFPPGWRDRVDLVREFSNLEVFGVSRQDLISNKLKAFMDRDFDKEDLLLMKITRGEFDKAVSFVKSFKDFDVVNQLDIDILRGDIFDE